MEDKCSACDGTKIETVDIQVPDGYGGYEWMQEDRPCSACQ